MPKVVDHKQRERELADAALDITSELGINAVTIRAIAERSGWSAGVLNYYFASRHEMLVSALHRAAELQGEVFKKVRHDEKLEPMVRLRSLVESILPLDDRRIALTHIFLMFYSESMSNMAIRQVISQYLGNWRHVVEQAIREAQAFKQIDDSLDPVHLAADLVALSDGLAMHALLEPAVAERIREQGIAIKLFGHSWKVEDLWRNSGDLTGEPS